MTNKVRACVNPLSWLPVALALAPAVAEAQVQTLDFPGATATRAIEINDLGQNVGFYYDANGVSTGFLYRSWSGGPFAAIDYPGARGSTGERTSVGLKPRCTSRLRAGRPSPGRRCRARSPG